MIERFVGEICPEFVSFHLKSFALALLRMEVLTKAVRHLKKKKTEKWKVHIKEQTTAGF